jgi:hypothetical protein
VNVPNGAGFSATANRVVTNGVFNVRLFATTLSRPSRNSIRGTSILVARPIVGTTVIRRTAALTALLLAMACRTSASLPADGTGGPPVTPPAAAPTAIGAAPAGAAPSVSPPSALLEPFGQMAVTSLGVSESVVAGRVVRRDTNARVAGATVVVPGLGLEAPVRMDGWFILLAVPPGAHLMEVRHPDFGIARVSLETGSPGKLIGPQAGPGGRIVGQIRAADGKPWTDVQIFTVWDGTARGAVSRLDGSFIMERVPPGTYELRAERLGLSSVVKEVVVTDSEQTEVFFELESRPLGWRPSP